MTSDSMLQEMKRFVNEYAATETVKDLTEWQLVLKEALAFTEVGTFMQLVDMFISLSVT